MNRIAAFVSALPDFGMAALFLATWIAPEAIEERMVRHLVSVVLLEFIIIHSSAFMGVVAISDKPVTDKVKAILGLTILYSLFAGGFSLAFKSWWPIAAFWGLSLNRLLPIILGVVPSEREKELIQTGWAITACAYLLLVTVTLFLPLPQLGITPAVIDRQELEQGTDEPGVWQTQPHRAMAFGFLYFIAVGAGEILAGTRAYGMISNRRIPAGR
jgi:hypothetical protein